VLPLAHFVNYPEFHLLDKDDVMMTIEHCQNCESHNWANHHVEEQYLEVPGFLLASLFFLAHKMLIGGE
jgi:hypothetical protein